MDRLRRTGLAAWPLLALLAACDGPAPPPELRGAVIFLLDTVRADHLSAYGHSRPTSPTLENLATRGVVFDQAVSYAPWTLPSVAALLSAEPAERAFDPGRGRLRRSLVESFRSAGFATGAVTEGGLVSRVFGFDRGFQDYREIPSAVPLLGRRGRPEAAGTAIQETFAAARHWLAEHAGERFLLLVHTYEPHAPYLRRHFATDLDPGALGPGFRIEDTRRLRSGELRLGASELAYLAALYDGGLHETDRQLGLFLEFLERQQLSERTLVVVTSDHGEDLGERDPAFAGDHGHGLHEELLRVPLILFHPGQAFAPRRVETPVWSLDLLPTLAEMLGVAVPEGLAGRSLLPLLRGEAPETRVIFGGATKSGPTRYFVREGRWKYIQGGGADASEGELYDLAADPRERHDLAGSDPARRARLAGLLEQRIDFEPLQIDPFLAAIRQLPEDGQEGRLREQLRGLGYIE